MAEAETQLCIRCQTVKELSEFWYSKKRRRHTRTCKACGDSNRLRPDLRPLAKTHDYKPIAAIYEELLPLMDTIRAATFEQLVKSEWTEDAMRLVMRALVQRATEGDTQAIKLIVEMRLKLRAEGDGSEEDIVNLAQLLAQDPLQTGTDTA